MKTYDREYFLDKFEAIPEDEWNDDLFKDEELYVKFFNTPGTRVKIDFEWNQDLASLFSLFRHTPFYLTEVNNGTEWRISGKSPKQRILAALRSLPD